MIFHEAKLPRDTKDQRSHHRARPGLCKGYRWNYCILIALQVNDIGRFLKLANGQTIDIFIDSLNLFLIHWAQLVSLWSCDIDYKKMFVHFG